MKKDRLAHYRKKLEEKQRQLVEEVGKNALYGKGPEDDSIKDLGDQASSAYNREFLFELGNGDRRVLKEEELIYVDYTFSASYRIPGSKGDEWRRKVDDNRLELVPFQDGYRILAGM